MKKEALTFLILTLVLVSGVTFDVYQDTMGAANEEDGVQQESGSVSTLHEGELVTVDVFPEPEIISGFESTHFSETQIKGIENGIGLPNIEQVLIRVAAQPKKITRTIKFKGSIECY